MTPDVVVIGGGPAGLATAIVLAKAGIATLICEARKSFPVDKPCGEGLMPTAIDDLERLGIPEVSVRASGAPFVGVRYISPRGNVAEARFPGSAGVGLRRTNLSALLATRARRLPSLTLMSGVVAKIRPRDDGSFSVFLDGEALTPRLVIGADGLSSRIRRQANIPERLRLPARWGVRQHFEGATWNDHVEVHWGNGAEAYVTPIGRDCSNVAFLWDKEHARVHEGAQGAFHQLLGLFPSLTRRFEGAKPSSAPLAAGPMHRAVPRPARDGLLLVGDAAGYVDAITGEGVGLALRQALLIEKHIVPVLSDKTACPVPLSAMTSYLSATRAAARSNHQLTRILLRLREHPALLERAIAAMQADPRVFRHLLVANMGCASPFRMPSAPAVRSLLRSFVPAAWLRAGGMQKA